MEVARAGCGRQQKPAEQGHELIARKPRKQAGGSGPRLGAGMGPICPGRFVSPARQRLRNARRTVITLLAHDVAGGVSARIRKNVHAYHLPPHAGLFACSPVGR